MKKELHIYLFRHGKTTYNTKHIFTGFKDAKLTAEGKKHAKIIAKKLKNKKFQVAIQTRLSRSKDTLKPVLKYHPECKTIFTDDRMIERSYGDLEGISHKKYIEEHGKEQYDKVHRGWNTSPPNGESFKMVKKRVKKFIKWLKKYMKKNSVNVAISAHGNSIRLFRHIMEKASIKETCSWSIPYDKVFEYEV
jgi:2,3-bisphosphoglycerate-dependent phosphoglycerate mutase